MLVLDVLDVVTLNESKSPKKSVSNLLSHFLPQVRGYYLRHTQQKNPTVYIFPGKAVGVAGGERCAEDFRFFDDPNMNQMVEALTATKQGSAKTKRSKTLKWKWVLKASSPLAPFRAPFLKCDFSTQVAGCCFN